MQTTDAIFFSDGLQLAGHFFRPDDWQSDQPKPLIIPCSGFTGVCAAHPARFSRFFTSRGYQCFGFDYRGFVDSEGTRNRVLLEEQVRDIIAAAAFAGSDPQVDATQIILLGWGMGGGLVLDAARVLPGVVGVAAVNGFYNGARFERAQRDEAQMQQFLDLAADRRAQRARTGQAQWVDPFDIYPLDPRSREYVDNVLRKTPGYEAESYSFELADSLLHWDVEAYGPHMQTPLLVVHGDANKLHPPGEARSLHDAYGGPKKLHWLQGAGHTEFMHDDNPIFQGMADHIEQWARGRLGG